MDKLKSKKTIGIVIILIMVISISILMYGKNNNSVFKDKYMENIFIENENEVFENKVACPGYSLAFRRVILCFDYFVKTKKKKILLVQAGFFVKSQGDEKKVLFFYFLFKKPTKSIDERLFFCYNKRASLEA